VLIAVEGQTPGLPEDDVEHLDEDLRIGVIEVPLIVVEHGHHPPPHLPVPGEVAGAALRKNLRHRLLEQVRDAAIGEGVVQYDIQHQQDAVPAESVATRRKSSRLPSRSSIRRKSLTA
jgi:hypothetical protein